MTFGRINQLRDISASWLVYGYYLHRIQRVHNAVLHYSRNSPRRHMGDNIWRREGFIIFKVHNTPKLTLITNNQPLFFYTSRRDLLLSMCFTFAREFSFLAESLKTVTREPSRQKTANDCFHCLQFTVLFCHTFFPPAQAPAFIYVGSNTIADNFWNYFKQSAS